MDERKQEMEFVLGMIHKLCCEYKIVLLPKETKKGTKYIGIVDATNGKEYAMINENK